LLDNAGKRAELHVHLAGTASYMHLVDNAQFIDRRCAAMGKQSGQYLPPKVLKAAADLFAKHPWRPDDNIPLASLDYERWDRDVFQRINNLSERISLSADNRAVLADFQRLQQKWVPSQQDISLSDNFRSDCCKLMEHECLIGCMFPTFQELFANSGVSSCLTEYRSCQGVDIVSGTYDKLELFELNFEVAKTYASLGGAEYLVKLLQTNTAFFVS